MGILFSCREDKLVAELMNGQTCPQYAEVVRLLAPVLCNLPPKIVAIDGWPGVGKTTLGRFLAWRFNVTLLETDLFMIPRQGKLVYHTEEITRIIDTRLRDRTDNGRPIIVEGVAVLRLLAGLQHEPDFMVYVTNTLVVDAGNLKREVTAYDKQFRPRERANLSITIEG